MKFHSSTRHEIGTAPCATNINGLEIFDNSGDSGYSSSYGTACADNPVIETMAYMYALGILFSVATGNNYNADACLYFSAASPLLLSRA